MLDNPNSQMRVIAGNAKSDLTDNIFNASFGHLLST